MADINKRIIQKIEDIITSSSGGDIFEIRNYEIINHNCGITLVKYRKKTRNLLHLASAVTTVGLSLPFTLAINYMVKNTWYNCYFETASGEFIGESHNDAAEAIKVKGIEAITKGDFEEAKGLFNEAFAICDENYSSRDTFVNFKCAMDFALDGVNDLKNGRFKEASEKFQEVINGFDHVPEIYDKFMICKSATEIAHQALELLILRIYREAMENFEDAHDQTDIDEIKVYYYNYKEVVKMIINADKLLAEHRIKDADELLCTALKKTSCIVVNQIISKELDNVRKKGKEREAARLYEEGITLWDKAWIAENNDQTSTAGYEFENAKLNFEEAYNLNRNPIFNEWILIVDYKIKGNELFNMGIQQQELHLYQDAYITYKKSKHCFQEGYNLSGDQRFMPSIEFIEKHNNEIVRIIENMPINIQVNNRTSYDYGHNNIVHDSTEHQYIFEQNN